MNIKKYYLALYFFITPTVVLAQDTTSNTQITASNTFTKLDRTGSVLTDAETFDINPTAATSTANGSFLKGSFAFTLSANVVMGIKDNGVVFAAGAGSPGGRNLFTGSTEGGSVRSCGDATTSSGTDTPDDLVVDGNISMAKAGGCGRTSTTPGEEE